MAEIVERERRLAEQAAKRLDAHLRDPLGKDK